MLSESDMKLYHTIRDVHDCMKQSRIEFRSRYWLFYATKTFAGWEYQPQVAYLEALKSYLFPFQSVYKLYDFETLILCWDYQPKMTIYV